MKFCEKCNIEINRPKSKICRKCYDKEYYEGKYQKKEVACAICGETSILGHRKYCEKCISRIESKCVDCGKIFFYGAKYKRCTTCEYHRYKKECPEKFKETRRKSNERNNAILRESQGLPIDHVFQKGPKGEGYLNKKGYRLMVYKKEGKGYIRKYQHVIVMSQYIGRELNKNETVHHKNGIRDDNRIENLELWHKGQPAGQRVQDKINWCLEFLTEYGKVEWDQKIFE